MRIIFKVEGGLGYFPGLSTPIVIDSSELAPQQAADLERLVREADFFDLSPKIGIQQSGAADYRQYTITLEEGGRQHTVRVSEPVENPNLAALVAFLQRKKLEGGRGRPP
jgi:hypothetical protein